MKHMKWKTFALASLLFAVLVLGCRPERMQNKPVNPRTMAFAQAGVSLVVGEECLSRQVDSDRCLYPPTLVTQAGSIRVVLLPPDRSNPATWCERDAPEAWPPRRETPGTPLPRRPQRFLRDSGCR